MNTSCGYDFIIADGRGAAPVYLNSDGSAYDGLSLIADAFAEDVRLVTGRTPRIITDLSSVSGSVIIVGTVGERSGAVAELAAGGRLDLSPLFNTDGSAKRECYVTCCVDNPFDGIDRALVIVGSDKRGAIYGVFRISEAMGVSPWVYFADVLPEKKTVVGFNADNERFITVSSEPSVRYRGIFLNDEAPSLTDWVAGSFGEYNYKFYRHVFELILRLKGNYLWPAMWNNDFSKDGVLGLSEDDGMGFGTLANAALANRYGIVMGTSHHEPMARAGTEWSDSYREYLTEEDALRGSAKTWDYFNCSYAIKRFWEDGYKRNMRCESVITVGMRGEQDSTLGYGLDESIRNLENVIGDQLDIMEKYKAEEGVEIPPTMLCLYKEVEEFWYGGEENGIPVKGLRERMADRLDGTIIMLSDDNFGNLRSMPMEDERGHRGGWGLYYHFDYHGCPIDYRWVSSTPLEKIHDNLTTAFEYKVDDVWIVNVGTLKPYEMEISYFLDLAYNFDEWSPVNKVYEYSRKWNRQQFGRSGVSDELIDDIARLQLDYMRVNGERRPEVVMKDTYSITDEFEAQRRLAKLGSIYDRVYEYGKRLPEELHDVYFQLVLYPTAASANQSMACIYAAYNEMFFASGSALANRCADAFKAALAEDRRIQENYNYDLSGGKWREMMSFGLNHMCAISWNLEKTAVPVPMYVTLSEGSVMIVNVSGSKTGIKNGSAALPVFYPTDCEWRRIIISNGGKEKFSYTASVSDERIRLSSYDGVVEDGEAISVSISPESIGGGFTGYVTISGAGAEVRIEVTANDDRRAELGECVFSQRNGFVSIEAAHFTASFGSWREHKNCGRTLSSMQPLPLTAEYIDENGTVSDDVPYLEYMVYIECEGEYPVTVYMSPTNPRRRCQKLIDGTEGVMYGMSVNGGEIAVKNKLLPGFDIGAPYGTWGEGVLNNIHTSTMLLPFSRGINKLRYYPLSAGCILQKTVISPSGSEYTKVCSYKGVKREYLTADLGNSYLGVRE